MNHFITLLQEKAGLNQEQARAASEAIMADLKKKFPSFLHNELDKIAAGGEFGDSAREKFNLLRDKLEEAAKKAGEKAEDLAEEVRNKFSELFGDKKKN
jgi:hypothetical protein